MRLRYESIGYQQDALDAIGGLFAGSQAEGCGPSTAHGPHAWANRLVLSPDALADNLRAVQARAGLSSDAPLREGETPHFSVEMETGTGKTFVFLSAMRRLHRDVGLRKFVIVVPSVAIREGVSAAADATSRHLEGQYGAGAFPTWVHRAADISRLRAFAQDPEPQALIINVQAFDRDANLLNRPHDDLSGWCPIDFLRATRPVVILDEPQNLEGEKSRAAIESLAPLCTLRFSATHRRRHHPIFRFGPVAAHDGGWVKGIEVDSVVGDDRDALVREQLRRTVLAHLEKEAALASRPGPRIKVLSLVFIDRVARYADADGPIRRWFEESWTELTADSRFAELDLPPVEAVHGGYFARDRKQRAKDSSGRTEADRDTYALILREKERLLDPDEPLRFVFSHSALREGWDNPNVFQLCTLNESRSALRKRQEIGRGLRLAVMENGERCRDPEVNRLTVVANEEYDAFARALQVEIEQETGDAFGDRARARGDRPRATATSTAHATLNVDPDRLRARATAAVAALPPCVDPPWQGPVPDPLVPLQRRTGLTRSTLGRILLESGRVHDVLRSPTRFVDRAAAAILAALDVAPREEAAGQPGGTPCSTD